MIVDNITEENFLLLAARCYENPSAITEEFSKDLKTFKYIKVLFKKLETNKEVNLRILLNHFIVLSNLFGDMFVPFMFFHISKKHWKYLLPFLILLNRLPKSLPCKINNEVIIINEIQLDDNLIKDLRNL